MFQHECLNEFFQKIQTSPMMNDEKTWTFHKIWFRPWEFAKPQQERTRKFKTLLVCLILKVLIQFCWKFQKTRPYDNQKSIFQYHNDFNFQFQANQNVRCMLLWRFIQVVQPQCENWRTTPHFSGTGVNRKIYAVRFKKFQRVCFEPR